jgi:tripartite-type tricarboxylate transporter receptor subunit TctC
LLAFSAGTLLLFAFAAVADEYPARPVRLITAGAPGSVPDTVARPLAARLEAELRQPVIVDNRPGAGGILAMVLLARAKPDGYTIGIVSTSQLVFNRLLFKKLPYDSLHDFVPVTKLVAGKVVLAAHPSFPANSLRELIALAKAAPGKINYAVPQLGAPVLPENPSRTSGQNGRHPGSRS